VLPVLPRSKSCSGCRTVTSHPAFLSAICLSILGESSLLKPAGESDRHVGEGRLELLCPLGVPIRRPPP